MGETTAIGWTDATVNFWWGCTKVGPGCDHCYAETWSKRTGGQHWGVGAPRRQIKGAAALIRKLTARAVKDGAKRVFIQSMSDLFDLDVPLEWFAEAWCEIEANSTLEIQIVTKRISVVEKRLRDIGRTAWPKHAGLLVTVCNQDEAERDVPRLLALKAKLGIPWVGVSAEPLLGPIDFTEIEYALGKAVVRIPKNVKPMKRFPRDTKIGDMVKALGGEILYEKGIDWIIAGGESGTGARPMHPGWARAIRDQCAAAGVPFFFKQWGEFSLHEIAQDGRTTPPVPAEFFRDVRPHYWKNGGFVLAGGDEPIEDVFGSGCIALRVGKARAGRLLDGRTHDEFPQVRA